MSTLTYIIPSTKKGTRYNNWYLYCFEFGFKRRYQIHHLYNIQYQPGNKKLETFFFTVLAALQFRTADLCALETAQWVTRKRWRIGRFNGVGWIGASQCFLGDERRIHWFFPFSKWVKCKAVLSFRSIAVNSIVSCFLFNCLGSSEKNNIKWAFNLQQTRLRCHFNVITLLRSKSLGADDRREVGHTMATKLLTFGWWEICLFGGRFGKMVLWESISKYWDKNTTKIIYPISHSQWKNKLHHSKKLA